MEILLRFVAFVVFGASEPANKWYDSALCSTSDVQHDSPTTEPSDAGVETPDPFGARSHARLSHRVVVLQTTCLPVAPISRKPIALKSLFFFFLFFLFTVHLILIRFACQLVICYLLLTIYLLYTCENNFY